MRDFMCIRDREGAIISKSRNLRGIREYVGRNLVKVVDATEVGARGEGQLSILFENGDSFQTNFASYAVLLESLSNWRNMYGAPLTIGGQSRGKVGYYNPALTGRYPTRGVAYFLRALTQFGPLNTYVRVYIGETIETAVKREALKLGVVFCCDWTAQQC